MTLCSRTLGRLQTLVSQVHAALHNHVDMLRDRGCQLDFASARRSACRRQAAWGAVSPGEGLTAG